MIDNQQLPYGSIYSLKLIKIETLKIYSKNNIAHNFINLFVPFRSIYFFCINI